MIRFTHSPACDCYGQSWELKDGPMVDIGAERTVDDRWMLDIAGALDVLEWFLSVDDPDGGDPDCATLNVVATITNLGPEVGQTAETYDMGHEWALEVLP